MKVYVLFCWDQMMDRYCSVNKGPFIIGIYDNINLAEKDKPKDQEECKYFIEERNLLSKSINV